MGRDSELRRLLDEAATFGRDPAGTTIGELLHEAGDEALAHGRGAARSYFARSLRWYTERLRGSGATYADSFATANLSYALGRWQDAAALLGPSPVSPDEIGMAGLIAVHLGRIGEGRAIASRLAADRTPYQFGGPYVGQARIAGLLGDTVTALTALQNAFKAGRVYDLWIHRVPELALLRSNPKFQDLVRPKQ
jgi:hypothetical protein